MKEQTKKRVLWVLSLLWMGVIFSFSMQNGDASAQTSSGLAEWIARQACVNFDGMEKGAREAALLAASYAVRKVAHLTEYAVLGALFSLLVRCYRDRIWLHSLSALAAAALYAATDELHQLLSDGRTARVLDVGIDSLGAACGILAAALCLLFAAQRKSEPARQKGEG